MNHLLQRFPVQKHQTSKYEMILCVTKLSFYFTKRQYMPYQICSKIPCHIETSQLMSNQCRKSIGWFLVNTSFYWKMFWKDDNDSLYQIESKFIPLSPPPQISWKKSQKVGTRGRLSFNNSFVPFVFNILCDRFSSSIQYFLNLFWIRL